MSKRPDATRGFHAVYDKLDSEGVGFGYSCSDDGLDWAYGALVLVPGGCRTPLGLLPFTADDYLRHNGTTGATYWLFYTQDDGKWEVVRTAIVRLTW